MKLRKIFAGMAAATIAMTMTLSASAATNLFDIVHPDESNEEINKAYYGIGAMGFFMNQTWKWNQSEWIPINDEGVIDFKYHIDEVMADTTMSGKGTLGDMGVMVCNLPEDNYPYNVEITDAKFVTDDGDTIEFPRINSTTIAVKDAESGYRIHIRPTAEIDDDGNVTKTPRSEVKGWDQEGAFKGGTLSMKINFNVDSISEEDDGTEPYTPEDEDGSSEDESTTDESTDETSDTGDESTDEESSEDAGSEDEESEADGDEESEEDENSEEDEDSDDGDSSSDDGKKSGGDSKDDKSSGGSTAGSSSTGSGSTGSGSGNAGGSNGGSSDANAKQDNSQTGAASNIILAALALAGTGMVATKKRK